MTELFAERDSRAAIRNELKQRAWWMVKGKGTDEGKGKVVPALYFK
jgi:hypothetical protein